MLGRCKEEGGIAAIGSVKRDCDSCGIGWEVSRDIDIGIGRDRDQDRCAASHNGTQYINRVKKPDAVGSGMG